MSALLLLVAFSLSASSAILVADYIEGFPLAKEVKLTAENYYIYETDAGRDVRYISSLDELSDEDDVLYVVAHGSEKYFLLKIGVNTDKTADIVRITWEELLQCVNAHGISNLILDTCKSNNAQELAEDMEFDKTLHIFTPTSYTTDETSIVFPGHASFYSFVWRFFKKLPLEYSFYTGKSSDSVDIRSLTVEVLNSCNDYA